MKQQERPRSASTQHTHTFASVTPHTHTHTRSTHVLAPLRMLARALGALRGRFDSQTPEKLLAENTLVTKSSQLPQISSARASGFQVFEKLPGPWQLPPAPLMSLSGSTQNASFPRSCRLEVKIILTIRQCPKGHGFSSHQPSGLPGAKSWEPPSQHCLTGQRQPHHPHVSHWQDLAGFASDPDLELLGPEMLSQCRRPAWLLASPTPAFSLLSLISLFTHCKKGFALVPERCLLLVVKRSKPRALGTSKYDQWELKRAPLNLLIF